MSRTQATRSLSLSISPLLLLLSTLLLIPISAKAQDTVIGHVKGPSAAAPTNAKICFILQNFKPATPRIVGTTAIIGATNFCISPAADGSFSTPVYDNNVINPAGTNWRVDFMLNGIQQSSSYYIVNKPLFNLDIETPVSSAAGFKSNQLVTQTFTFVQSPAASTWTVTHNLADPAPLVQVYDSAGTQFQPVNGTPAAGQVKIVATDANTTTLTFASAQTGTATILHAGSVALATNQPNAVLQNPSGTQTIGGPGLTITAPTTLSGTVTAPGLFKSGDPWMDVMSFGAFANTRSGADFNMTGGSAVLTSNGQGFSSGDVGKIAVVSGAGAAGTTLVTTVASFQSSTQVTLAASASVNVTNATATLCNSDVPAINAAMNAGEAQGILRTNGGQGGYPAIFFPPGNYCIDTPITVRSSPWVGPPGNAWAMATTISWVGTPGGTMFTKSPTDPGGASYWAFENFRFLYSGSLPGTWFDFTSSPIDIGLRINGVMFGASSGDAIKVSSFANFHLDHIRWDGTRGYAIRFTPTVASGGENQGSFSIRDWTYDNFASLPSSVTPGVFYLDNTQVNASNWGQFHFADARIEANNSFVSPNCILCLAAPNAGANFPFVQVSFDNINVQPGGVNPFLAYSLSTQSGIVPASLAITNSNFAGATAMTILGGAGANPWNNYQIVSGNTGQIRFAVLDGNAAIGNSAGPAQVIGIPLLMGGSTSDPTGTAGMLNYRTDLNRHRFFDTAWHSTVGVDTTDILANKSTPVGPLAGTVASGATTMGTTAVANLACADLITVAATGVLTTDTIIANFSADPGNSGILTLVSWPTSGNVNFKYCNASAGSVTPAAATINWRVVR